MKVYFLHNHYLPAKIKSGALQIKSVIVPELYPDLNNVYLGEPCYFKSVRSYIEYVVQRGYYSTDTVYSIENNRVINPSLIRETLLEYTDLGVKIIQLYCGSDNQYFSKGRGLSPDGERLLFEISRTNMLLDLSHIPNDSILTIANRFDGRMIISHCACSDLYASRKSRSNSLTHDSVYQLAKRVEVFGISFLNDIVALAENELSSTQIFDDIIAQTLLFVETAGADKVALAPDYIDTEYFGKHFNTKLVFPDTLLAQEGLLTIADTMRNLLSRADVKKIFSGNVERLFG